VATYAVGDVQGCFLTLQKLLARIPFDPAADTLWLVGDLVNRGPRSLETLRWAKGLGARHRVVLGNHDIHLLACAEGISAKKPRDTLDEVLHAPDRKDLLAWLRERPFLVREREGILVHAGVHPAWTGDDAERLAHEAERALRKDLEGFLVAGQEKPPKHWDDGLRGDARLSYILAALTRMRIVHPDGRMDLKFKGPPSDAPPGTIPWFRAERRTAGELVVFGHWAALGLDLGPTWIATDTGCVWGHALTAVRLDDRKVFAEDFAD
jgi:bis(5'-nucleosyl)-tetraphosphatase (symmetrical)